MLPEKDMDKTFYLETFGCQMNVVDSERIVDLLGGIGYRQVPEPRGARLLLLNTCAVRDKAARKAYGHLGRFKPLKDADPALIIGLGGCVAQQEGERLLKDFPYLDLVFGTHNVHRLPELVNDIEVRRGKAAAVDFLDRETRLQLFPSRIGSEAVTRFVTVMQGCDNFCSFCVVPIVRGREISRPSADILDEVRDLAAQGVREITLIGQNVNSYGVGVAGETNFAGLLRQVAAIEGVARIRFTTSHPKDLSDELIACFGSIDQLCRHLHLPVQSGSDRDSGGHEPWLRSGPLPGTGGKTACGLPGDPPDHRYHRRFPRRNGGRFCGDHGAARGSALRRNLLLPLLATPGDRLPPNCRTTTPAAVKQERFDRMLARRTRSPRRPGRRMSARCARCWSRARAGRGRASCSGAPPGTGSSTSAARRNWSGNWCRCGSPNRTAIRSWGSWRRVDLS